jgi:hypothetical protein
MTALRIEWDAIGRISPIRSLFIQSVQEARHLGYEAQDDCCCEVSFELLLDGQDSSHLLDMRPM